MFIQLAILTIFLISIPFAGLGLRLLLQPHRSQVNRNKVMMRRNISYMKDADVRVINGDKNETI